MGVQRDGCRRDHDVLEELDICLQDGQFELISGTKRIRIDNSQLSEEEANWVFQSISAQQSLPRRLSL